MERTIQLSKSNIALYLILIIIISLGLKLYTVDFSIPPHSDDFGYIVDSIQYNQGDFFVNQKKNPGWPIFLAPFLSIINSDNFLDYANIARILTIGISTITIIPMYILARRFFDEKYSLVASCLFAFEPHLNYNSGGALSEPLLILILITSMIFILQHKTKYHYLAFIFTGLCWWVRLEVIYPIIAIILIYFLIHRSKPNSLRNFSFCIVLLLIIISPIFIQRDIQFDDPFYVWYDQTILSDDYAELLTSPENAGMTDFVDKHGVIGLLDRLVNGLANLFSILVRISYPYLLILIPFGVLFSLRPIDQKMKNIKANWIMIITIISIIMIPFAIMEERRWLFPILPFLIILSTIPIQRVVHYGLNTFSFSDRQKSVFLVISVSIILVLSSTFTMGIGEFGYGSPNSTLEHEKIKFTEHLVENFDGKILRDQTVDDYLAYVNLVSNDNNFKSFKSPQGKDPYPDLYEPGKVVRISIYGKTMEELITNGEPKDLKFIGVLDQGSYFFPFLSSLYHNEEDYPYMKKVFDSNAVNYKEFKVKVFEIDYEKFHQFVESKLT